MSLLTAGNNFKKALIAIPAVLVAAGIVLFAIYSAPEITWKNNAGQMYRLEMESKVSMYYQGKAADIASRLNAVLNFKITQISDDAINATMQLSEIYFTHNDVRNPAYEQMLGAPFQVKFAKSGEVLGYSFAFIGRGDDKYFRGIVSSLECVMKKSFFGGWSNSEKDEYGTYAAAYSSGDDGSVIRKTKKKYTESDYNSEEFPGNTEISVVKSDARFEFAKECSWVKELDSFELIRFLANGKKTMDAVKKVNLVLADFKPDASLAVWGGGMFPGFRTLYESWDDECAGCREKEYSYEYLIERETMKQFIKGDTIEGVLAGIVRANGDDQRLARKLKFFIMLYPDVVKKIYDNTLRKRYTNSVLAVIMQAMTEAGNDNAQDYLRKVALETKIGKTVNLMSTVNIGSLKEPSPETLATLKQLYGSREGKMDAMISNSSILSLGRIASSLKGQEGGGNAQKEIGEYIMGQLGENSGDPNIAASCVAALGTIGDSEYFDTVKSYLGNESGFVRASAVTAMKNFENEDVPEILRDQFESEKDEMVKETIIEGLAKLPADDDSIDLIKESLPGEKNEKVRNVMLRYLSGARDQDPEIMTVLKNALKTERSNPNRDVIFKAIYSKKGKNSK